MASQEFWDDLLKEIKEMSDSEFIEILEELNK